MCPGSVVRWPFDPCVEVVPVDPGAVPRGDAERLVPALGALLPCASVEALESFVGHRVGREPRVALGTRRVLVAPPADRLQAPDQAQPAMAAQHVAQTRVPRLDEVVRRRHRPAGRDPLVEEREQPSLVDAATDHAPGPDEPLVHVVDAAVGVFALLVEESGELPLPPVVGDEPGRGVVPVPDARQGDGDVPEPPAGLQAGSSAGQFEDVGPHVEQAALDPRVRPHRLRGLEDPAPAVAYEHVGRRDARHQALPRRRPLAPGDVPADHVPVGHRDQDHRVAVQVDAVHVHHVMRLVHQRHGRPQAPHELAPAAQCARGQRVLGLGPLREQPVQSASQVAGPHVVRA